VLEEPSHRLGFDLVEIGRFRAALRRHPRLLERLFTAAELEYCLAHADPVPYLAARFAAKESVGKSLGRGVTSWPEIEIAAGPQRLVRLRGRAAALAAESGVRCFVVSLTHTATTAGACVLACGNDGEGRETVRDTTGGLTTHHGLEERPRALTAAQVRELDRITIEDIGVPGPVLMERAALGISELILRRYRGRHTLIACGRGNNGGDGLAAARQLHLAGHPVACIVAADSAQQLSPDAALNLRAALGMGVNVRLGSVPDYLWEETEVVVDCLLGTGATGELRAPLSAWAGRINALGARGVPVVAVDIPSGVDATTGAIAAGTVAATCTVTFHAAKTGLVVPPGAEAAGEVLVWDIGLVATEVADVRVVTSADVTVPGRRPDDHKYRAGYVAVAAGSSAYAGAAYLASRAAARSGAGYVRLLAPPGVVTALRERLVEVVTEAVGSGEALSDAGALLAAASDERIGALVIGPGVGRSESTLAAVRAFVLGSSRPAVLDADGLFAFAGEPEALRGRASLILTPHVGELAALLGTEPGELGRRPLAAARVAAETTGQVVVLKGSSTIICGPDGVAWAVVQGPPQLASAGTGDVLSGCLGALLATGMSPLEAAKAGVWLHAEAGRLGALARPAGLLAGDLLELLPEVLSLHVHERRPTWRT
jgi:ADP-dependent NAD(P)H-hydrate dehydratase / NAD(P)H-hydrate epimerase